MRIDAICVLCLYAIVYPGPVFNHIFFTVHTKEKADQKSYNLFNCVLAWFWHKSLLWIRDLFIWLFTCQKVTIVQIFNAHIVHCVPTQVHTSFEFKIKNLPAVYLAKSNNKQRFNVHIVYVYRTQLYIFPSLFSV